MFFILALQASEVSSPIERCKAQYEVVCVKESDLQQSEIIEKNSTRIQLSKSYWKDFSYSIKVGNACGATKHLKFKYIRSYREYSILKTNNPRCNIIINYNYADINQLDDIITSVFTEIKFCTDKDCVGYSLSDFILPEKLKSDIISGEGPQ